MSLCVVTPTYLSASALGPAASPAPCPRGFFGRLFCGVEPPVYQAGSPAGGDTTSGGAGLSAGAGPSSSTSTASSGPKPPPFVPGPEPVLVVGNDVWVAVWQDLLERMSRITLVRNA